MVDVTKTAAPATAPKNVQAVKAAPNTPGKRATGETEEQKKIRKEGIAARRKTAGK